MSFIKADPPARHARHPLYMRNVASSPPVSTLTFSDHSRTYLNEDTYEHKQLGVMGSEAMTFQFLNGRLPHPAQDLSIKDHAVRFHIMNHEDDDERGVDWLTRMTNALAHVPNTILPVAFGMVSLESQQVPEAVRRQLKMSNATVAHFDVQPLVQGEEVQSLLDGLQKKPGRTVSQSDLKAGFQKFRHAHNQLVTICTAAYDAGVHVNDASYRNCKLGKDGRLFVYDFFQDDVSDTALTAKQPSLWESNRAYAISNLWRQAANHAIEIDSNEFQAYSYQCSTIADFFDEQGLLMSNSNASILAEYLVEKHAEVMKLKYNKEKSKKRLFSFAEFVIREVPTDKQIEMMLASGLAHTDIDNLILALMKKYNLEKLQPDSLQKGKVYPHFHRYSPANRLNYQKYGFRETHTFLSNV